MSRQNHPESSVVRSLRRYFDSLGYLTVTELNLGYGRADLVAFRINARKARARFLNGQLRSLEKLVYYSVLDLLPEMPTPNPVRLENISAYLNLSPYHVRREILSFLLKFGYIIETKEQAYAKRNGFVPIADEIVAVEAKISDWKYGAIQAKRYKIFANRVYLALAESYTHRANQDILSKHGIGLFSVGKNIREDLTAPCLPPKDHNRYNFATEWAWRYRRDFIKGVTNASDQSN